MTILFVTVAKLNFSCRYQCIKLSLLNLRVSPCIMAANGTDLDLIC